MTEELFVFFIGLIALILFSIYDLKHLRIDNKFIIIYLLIALNVLFWTGNYIVQIFFFIFWVILGFIMWRFNTIGGADYKILMINSIFITAISINVTAGQFIFIMLFGIIGLFYGLLAKLTIKNKEVPFILIITLTYIINYIFWTIK